MIIDEKKRKEYKASALASIQRKMKVRKMSFDAAWLHQVNIDMTYDNGAVDRTWTMELYLEIYKENNDES